MNKCINILLACMLASCSKHAARPIQESAISIVDDRTDEFILHPAINPILRLYNFQENKNQAATFRIRTITDKRLTPCETIHLPDAMETEALNTKDDIEDREKVIYSFCDSVRQVLAHLPQQFPPGSTMEHSECFAAIASELTWLSSRKATQKVLIVYGDLEENGAFNSYSKKGKYLLEHSPQKVAALLEAQHPLPHSLTGITVCFVFMPATREQDQEYGKMVSMYSTLLRSCGASVIIQAQNTSYEL